MVGFGIVDSVRTSEGKPLRVCVHALMVLAIVVSKLVVAVLLQTQQKTVLLSRTHYKASKWKRTQSPPSIWGTEKAYVDVVRCRWAKRVVIREPKLRAETLTQGRHLNHYSTGQGRTMPDQDVASNK